MPLLKWLFPPANRTHGWLDDGRAVVLDLDVHRLGGVGIRDDFGRLDGLGPGKRVGDVYRFTSQGIAVDVDDAGRVAGFVVFFGHDDVPEAGGFARDVTCGGAAWRLAATTTEHEWTERIGAPYWRDVDVDEVLVFHEWDRDAHGEPGIEWQVEFGGDGGLKCVGIAPPCSRIPLNAGPTGSTYRGRARGRHDEASPSGDSSSWQITVASNGDSSGRAATGSS